ncbi:MAG: flagellar basal body rod protein FlgB [Armatimonadota bacterium]
MADLFLDRTTAILAKVLDGTAVRQRALANNIANAETPGYQRRDVDFATQLRDVIGRSGSDPRSIVRAVEAVAVQMHEDATAPRKLDGNSVNIEREMVELAQNSLQYETSAQMLMMKIRGLKYVIHEGRR